MELGIDLLQCEEVGLPFLDQAYKGLAFHAASDISDVPRRKPEVHFGPPRLRVLGLIWTRPLLQVEIEFHALQLRSRCLAWLARWHDFLKAEYFRVFGRVGVALGFEHFECGD